MNSPRENLLRTLRRRGFESVPIDPNAFSPSQLDAFEKKFGHRDYYSFFNCPIRHVSVPIIQTFTEWKEKYFKNEELPEDINFDVFGIGHSKQSDCFHMTRMHHPLRGDNISLSEIENYPLPKIKLQSIFEQKQIVERFHEQNLPVIFSMACTIWEKSWYIRSMEDLMSDMMLEDPKAECLLDRITEFSIKQGKIAAEIDVDVLQLGDDIGMQQSIMMSLELWRKWLKPRLAKVISEVRKIKPDILIFYHSCGYVIPFLEDLAEIGIDILNPVQPECMDFAEVHKIIGNKMSFWSTIGTQSTLPFGTPQDVKKQVERTLAHMR